MQRIRNSGAPWLVGCLAWWGVGCGDAHRGLESFDVVRVVEERAPRMGVPTAERFGFTGAAAPGRQAGGTGRQAAPSAGQASEPVLAHELPEGWRELAPTDMRTLNLLAAGDARAEVTLTFLNGDGGGLAANVDRWRAQLGLAPFGKAGIAALERRTLLGVPAVWFDAAGTYGGMALPSDPAAGGGPGYRMLGLLAVDPEGSAFLKFTGPEEIVRAELAAFETFAASLRFEWPATDHGYTHGHGSDHDWDDCAEHGAKEPGARAYVGGAHQGASEARTGGQGLAWTRPDPWVDGAARPMRVATWHAGTQGEVEIYMAVLAGDGGGVRSNLDRWRGQIGLGPLSPAEHASLERVDALGVQAVLIEATGHYRGMGESSLENAYLLGAVAMLDQRTVFLKLIGPQATARAQRGHFLELLSSLEEVR